MPSFESSGLWWGPNLVFFSSGRGLWEEGLASPAPGHLPPPDFSPSSVPCWQQPGREIAANPLIPSDVTVWQFTALKVMLLGSQDTSQEVIQLMLSIVCGFIQQVQCSASALLLLPGCLTFVSDESPCFPAGANLLSLEQEASFCVC